MLFRECDKSTTPDNDSDQAGDSLSTVYSSLVELIIFYISRTPNDPRTLTHMMIILGQAPSVMTCGHGFQTVCLAVFIAMLMNPILFLQTYQRNGVE